MMPQQAERKVCGATARQRAAVSGGKFCGSLEREAPLRSKRSRETDTHIAKTVAGLLEQVAVLSTHLVQVLQFVFAPQVAVTVRQVGESVPGVDGVIQESARVPIPWYVHAHGPGFTDAVPIVEVQAPGFAVDEQFDAILEEKGVGIGNAVAEIAIVEGEVERGQGRLSKQLFPFVDPAIGHVDPVLVSYFKKRVDAISDMRGPGGRCCKGKARKETGYPSLKTGGHFSGWQL